MKKPFTSAVGIISILAFMVAVPFGIYFCLHPSDPFFGSKGIPLLVLGIASLVFGILSLKKERLIWGLLGLFKELSIFILVLSLLSDMPT